MNDYFAPISEGYRNNLMFHTVEVDKTKIKAFVKEGFEHKLGKDSVLNIRISSDNQLIIGWDNAPLRRKIFNTKEFSVDGICAFTI